MAALSKLSNLKELSLPYNCYEVGHTWTPFCSEAAVQVGIFCFRESLKIYTPLYLLSLAFHRKINSNVIYGTLESIFMSTCFLSFNAFGFVLSICSIRRLMGKFYYLHCSYIPGFVANCFAILLERPSRRAALALYTTNGASETLYRMAVARNWVKPIQHGEILIFSMVMAGFLYFMRKRGFHRDFVSTGLKIILGSDEAKPKEPVEESKPKSTNNKSKSAVTKKIVDLIAFVVTLLKPLPPFKQLSHLGKHSTCPHNDSCFLYFFKGFIRPFAMSWAASILLGIVSSRSKILKSRHNLFKVLKNKSSLKFGLFIGGFAGVFKIVNCLLRWVRNKDSEVHAIPAGLMAGSCMFLSPNSSVAVYLMWKLFELLYSLSVENGYLPSFRLFTPFLYSVTTGVLFYAAVLEPHNLKPTYWNFLNRITDNRISEINRHVLDIFGVHSSRMNHDFWPCLDMKYTSRSFQETVLVWMIH